MLFRSLILADCLNSMTYTRAKLCVLQELTPSYLVLIKHNPGGIKGYINRTYLVWFDWFPPKHEDFTLSPLFWLESTGVHQTPLDSTGLWSIPNGTGTPSDFESHGSPLYFSSQNRVESTGNKHRSPVIVQSDQPEFHQSLLYSCISNLCILRLRNMICKRMT